MKMRKTLIAGAATMAIAALPAAGVFATSVTKTVTDNLEAKVATACSFLRYGTAGASGQTGVETGGGPTWDGPTTSGTADNDATGTGTNLHKYSVSIVPTADVELGTSSFIGYCNATAGFDVTVSTPDLAKSGTTDKISFSGTAPDSTTGEGWTLAKNGGTLFTNTGTDTKFMTASGPTDSANAVTETATYKVYTNSTTKSGTYTGAVVYTFTYDDPNVSGS